MLRISVVDSHTAGEPTRAVLAGGPELGPGPMSAQRERFRSQFDDYRRAIVCEPRGSDVLVGALLRPPADTECVAGVIFFNNVGYLGMCGHGTIGVAVTLGYLGRLAAGRHRLETPVGSVTIDYDGRKTVTLENVPSFRTAANVTLTVPELGVVRGDVAWGGNWFFLTSCPGESITLANVPRLTAMSLAIRAALARDGITGADGQEIDHIELFGPPHDPRNHSRSFVLCPGGVYDRSPCGTGTSAKIACLAADGRLPPGDVWRQESVTGGVLEGWYRRNQGEIVPSIRGRAYITSESTLIIDETDPLAWGMGS